MSEPIIKKRTVFGWWIFGVGLAVIAVVVFTILNYAGLIFYTKVERKVFEESYQYKAGQKQKLAVLRAQLAEIEAQLAEPNLNPAIRQQLIAKRAAIRVLIRAATQQ